MSWVKSKIFIYKFLGSASVSKGLSVYLDAILDNEISNYLREAMPINIPYISSYPDLFSLGVVLLFSSKYKFMKC